MKMVRLLLFVCLCCFPSFAQQTGSISGTVKDQSGAVIVGAKATIRDAAGAAQSALTNEEGVYVIAGLAPGSYSVTISIEGLKDFTTDSVVVAAGQATQVDATLVPTEVSSSVNVTSSTIERVETERADIAGTITGPELRKLGLNGRNFTQLITLAPGVSSQTNSDEAKVGVKGSVKYSVNGGRVEYNTFEVDGSDVINPSIHGSDTALVVTPSLDALTDVQVLTSNYGAQYGRSASGTIVATTKSGSAEFHGNGYYYNRNEIFNARNFFDQTKSAPLYRKNDLGFTLGGPLYIPGVYNTSKTKTFWFFSEENRAEQEPQDFNHAVPSVAERQGNFSDVCPFAAQFPGGGGQTVAFSPTKYPDCPAAGLNITPTGFTFNTFQGNQLPVSSVASAILGTGIIPAPNATSGCTSSINSCYDEIVSPKTYWRQELFRIDHNFTSKEKLMLRYIHDEWDTIVPTPQWGYVNDSFPTVQNRFYGPGISAVARFTSTLTDTLINDLTLSYTEAHISLADINGPNATFERSAAEPAISTIGYIFNLSSTDFGNKLPGIVIGGQNAAYGGAGFAVDPSYMPWNFDLPTYSIRDEVGKVTHKHFLQMGAQALVFQKNEINPPVGAATGDTQGLLTFINGSPISPIGGNAFANFLVGGIHSYTQDSGQMKYYQRYQSVEPYFQDTWHVTQRLTLNLGVRISLFGTYSEKFNNAYNWQPSAFDPTLNASLAFNGISGVLVDSNSPSGCFVPPVPLSPQCSVVPLNLSNLDPRLTNGLAHCGTSSIPSGCMKGHLFNPAPRIGFAWDPTGGGKTSIRAGYGIFFEHGTPNEANTGSLEGGAPLVLSMTEYNVPGSYQCIGGNGPSICGEPGAFPLNVTAIQNRAMWPYVQQWSLSVQHQITPDTIASVAYVGSKGTHLATELQINQLQPLTAANNPFGPGEPFLSSTCQQTSAGVYTLPNGTMVTTSDPAYVNLTAACYSVGASFTSPDSLRNYHGIGQVYYLADIADSRYNALQATIRRTKGFLTLSGAYTYGHSLDDSSDRSDATFVNAFDLAGNKASSNFDQRHIFNASYILNFSLRPLVRAFNWADDDSSNTAANQPRSYPLSNSNGAWGNILDGWELSGITTFQTGIPFTVINAGSFTGIGAPDNAGVANGTGVGSYPSLMAGQNPHAAPGGDSNIPGTFGPLLGNPAAFIAPQALTFGDAGRNFMNNPSRLNFDTSLLKNFRVRESMNLELRAEVFNVFNHTQFRIYDPNLGNTSSNTVTCYGGPNNSALGGLNADGTTTDCLTGNGFLHPVDAHRPRTMQLGIRLSF